MNTKLDMKTVEDFMNTEYGKSIKDVNELKEQINENIL